MAAVEAHEERLFRRLVDGLASIGGVVRHGAPARHTPTVLFSVRGRTPHASFTQARHDQLRRLLGGHRRGVDGDLRVLGGLVR